MNNIKNILDLPVLSLYEGEFVGTVSKIFFDKKLKKLTALQLVTEDDLRYILYPQNIYKLGKNAITIKNSSCLELYLDENLDYVVNPYNSKTYTIQGEYLGKIEEITINEKYHICSIILDNGNNLDNKNLASCSKNTIIMYDENTKVNVKKFNINFSPKFLKSKNKQVKTMPAPQEENETTNLETSNISNNRKFLIGRIALKDIMLDEKKTLIKANSTVTENVINNALIANKIKELMLYSKQK